MGREICLPGCVGWRVSEGLSGSRDNDRVTDFAFRSECVFIGLSEAFIEQIRDSHLVARALERASDRARPVSNREWNGTMLVIGNMEHASVSPYVPNRRRRLHASGRLR